MQHLEWLIQVRGEEVVVRAVTKQVVMVEVVLLSFVISIPFLNIKIVCIINVLRGISKWMCR